MSDTVFNKPTRRDVLIAFGATGALTPLLAQHVHQAVGEVKSLDPGPNYKPKYLTAHEYATLRKLSDFIIPVDEHSKGALDAGAAEFIDYLCAVNDRMANSFTGGLAWIDDEMQRRFSSTFLGATREEQTKLLDEISYRKDKTESDVIGVTFFAWSRGMMIDA